ncbi:Aste57867_16675 [Aphanomyces stellatus]|uniref:subtilisin n=1 Tax=Aphanomyces stellatus TaxID=120398 RepID=A0A485L6Y6_9STRA|nr:hypothetical protein As57867_016618 [Aphanomyces stellatus]VFT93446.1 Aste57867_16675 [Aphanomyces stellatus]
MLPLRHVLVAAIASASLSAKISVQVHRNLELDDTTNVVVKFHCDQALANHHRRLRACATRADTISSVVESLQEYTTAVQNEVLDMLHESRIESTSDVRAMAVRTTWIDCAMYIDNITPEILHKVAASPQVESVHEPFVVKLESPRATPPIKSATKAARANQWGVDRIQAPAAWAQGNTGQGIVVGSIDAGVRYTHEALKSNWRAEYGWFDPFNGTDAPYDKWGHGTHVTGTIAGANGIGVAPGAKWISCLGCNYLCHQEQLIQCAQFMLCPTDTKGNKNDCTKAPHVINNSWGNLWGSDWFDGSLVAWRAAGIIPVFSMGNDGAMGCGTTNYPGSSPLVIAVGGTNSNHGLYHSSSMGPTEDDRIKPDVAAPGEDVVSASNKDDSSVETRSGTSMASPHVTGAVALYLSAHGGATFDQVYAALTTTTATQSLVPTDEFCANIPPTQFPNNVYGYGQINAFEAVKSSANTLS